MQFAEGQMWLNRRGDLCEIVSVTDMADEYLDPDDEAVVYVVRQQATSTEFPSRNSIPVDTNMGATKTGSACLGGDMQWYGWDLICEAPLEVCPF